jgi:hypothetical protein
MDLGVEAFFDQQFIGDDLLPLPGANWLSSPRNITPSTSAR